MYIEFSSIMDGSAFCDRNVHISFLYCPFTVFYSFLGQLLTRFITNKKHMFFCMKYDNLLLFLNKILCSLLSLCTLNQIPNLNCMRLKMDGWMGLQANRLKRTLKYILWWVINKQFAVHTIYLILFKCSGLISANIG